jgi:hypothetical protein
MDHSTFIVRLVEALAWPIVAGVAFWSVRGRLADLINRVQRVKWKDAEATFVDALDNVQARVSPLSPVEERAAANDRLVSSQLPPAYVVQQAWLRLEQALLVAAEGRGLQTQQGRGVNSRLIASLELRAEDRALIEDMRQLRNAAVHSIQPGITATDALRYEDLAESLARRIVSEP